MYYYDLFFLSGGIVGVLIFLGLFGTFRIICDGHTTLRNTIKVQIQS